MSSPSRDKPRTGKPRHRRVTQNGHVTEIDRELRQAAQRHSLVLIRMAGDEESAPFNVRYVDQYFIKVETAVAGLDPRPRWLNKAHIEEIEISYSKGEDS